MNKNYQVLQEALDKATQKGAFSLQETGIITQALIATNRDLQELEKMREAQSTAKEASLEAPTKKGK